MEFICTENNKTSLEWHRKFGHMSFKNLKKMPNLCDGTTLDVNKCKNDVICSVCIQGKHVRRPYNTVRDRALRPLEIIHLN